MHRGSTCSACFCMCFAYCKALEALRSETRRIAVKTTNKVLDEMRFSPRNFLSPRSWWVCPGSAWTKSRRFDRGWNAREFNSGLVVFIRPISERRPSKFSSRALRDRIRTPYSLHEGVLLFTWTTSSVPEHGRYAYRATTACHGEPCFFGKRRRRAFRAA